MPLEPTKARFVAEPPSITLHASCVRWSRFGLLIKGKSGSGKSGLALELIGRGAVLVADDVVNVSRINGDLFASGVGMRGTIEVRSQGIFVLPSIKETILEAQILLESKPHKHRLPPVETVDVLGINLPNLRLGRVSSSAIMAIRTLLTRARKA